VQHDDPSSDVPLLGSAAPEAIAADARAAGALVYVHDRPDLSDLAMAALARRGPLTLAVSTNGLAPSLARRVREELERALTDAGTRLDALIATLSCQRATLLASGRATELYRIASRLHLRGGFAIDEPAPSSDPATSTDPQ